MRKTIHFVALLALLSTLGCVSTRVFHGPTGMGGGYYPDINYLPADQRCKVTISPKVVRSGKISNADWNAILALVSRFPDSRYQQNMNLVCCSGGLDMTVSVELEFDWHYRVLFVKTGPSEWKVAVCSEVDR